jgi:hypothetical protein
VTRDRERLTAVVRRVSGRPEAVRQLPGFARLR